MGEKSITVLLSVIVVLAGCTTTLDSGQTTTQEPAPDQHEFVFASQTGGTAFEGAITVSKGSETVFEQNVTSDGNGTYLSLAARNESGPYTVTVNTTIPAGNENVSDRFTVPGDSGNATVITADFHGVSHERLPLPRQSLEHPLGAYSHYVNIGGSDEVDIDVRVWYRGERIVSKSVGLPADQLTRVTELERTGVYRVAARVENAWTESTLVIADPENFIYVGVNARGEVNEIQVRKARLWGEDSDS